MKDMNQDESASRLIQDMLAKGDSIFSHLVSEAEAVKVTGAVEPDIQLRRNELLLKIGDRITEVTKTLEYVDTLEKQLKEHRGKLHKLRKILSK